MYISSEHRFTQAQSYWLALLLSTYLLFDTQKWDKHKILTEKEYKALYIPNKTLNTVARVLARDLHMNASNLSSGVHAININEDFVGLSAKYRLVPNRKINGFENIKDKLIRYNNTEYKVQSLKDWEQDTYAPVLNAFLYPEPYSSEDFIENIQYTYTSKIRSRNLEAMHKAKIRDKFTCVVCGFRFGNKIVEAHHLKPLSSSEDICYSNESDIITLCPTCHKLAHYMLRDDKTLYNKNTLIQKLTTIVTK